LWCATPARDNATVLTGSTNFTDTGTNPPDNPVVTGNNLMFDRVQR
jgi:hypothetical protein